MSFWTQPENVNRCDNPNRQLPKITELQQHEAALYLIQAAARDLEKAEREKAERPGEDENP